MMVIDRPLGIFLSRLGLIGLLAAGLAGCASPVPRDTQEGWVQARPLGGELPAFRPTVRPAANVGTPETPATPTLSEPAEAPDEPTGILTLRDALGRALLKNPDLASTSWEVRVSDARILQAGLLPNPELAVDIENFGGTGTRRGGSGVESTFGVSQLIELGGKRKKRTLVASLERDLAGWEYESKRLDIYVATAEAFMDTLGAQRNTELQRSQFALARSVRDAADERVKAGRAAPIESTKAAIELASRRIASERATRELQAARDRLAAMWGDGSADFARAEGQFDAFTPLPLLPDLVARLPENPDVARADKDFELRRSALDLEKARNIPDLTLSAGVRRFEDNGDSAFVAGVSIPIPVFGINPGGVLEAERRLPQQNERTRATLVRITSALKQTYREGVALHAELVALTNEILPGAQQAFDVAQQGYREGKFNFLSVLDAQRTLFDAHERYIDTALAYHRATLEIERLTGQPLVPLSDRHE